MDFFIAVALQSNLFIGSRFVFKREPPGLKALLGTSPIESFSSDAPGKMVVLESILFSVGDGSACLANPFGAVIATSEVTAVCLQK